MCEREESHSGGPQVRMEKRKEQWAEAAEYKARWAPVLAARAAQKAAAAAAE
jgi:hypothetical protein